MTFADRSCGMTARYVSGRPTLATVQMDTHFVDSGKIGEILISKPRVVRATRSLIFVTTEVTADKRCIAMASGVFKILKDDRIALQVSVIAGANVAHSRAMAATSDPDFSGYGYSLRSQ